MVRFVVDTILFIQPILEKFEITGESIGQKHFFDNFVKRKILIRNPNKQQKILEWVTID